MWNSVNNLLTNNSIHFSIHSQEYAFKFYLHGKFDWYGFIYTSSIEMSVTWDTLRMPWKFKKKQRKKSI